ncbi:MAG TPA: SRPBCC family protein [Paucimonas sp.]|nr:SRPBCC family protein [Paucimonas sp.]
MKFTHLIEINDPLNPLIEPLSREQLWRGLVLRAESPQMFIPWLDSCTLIERSAAVLSRELRYGTLTVRDTVTFVPQQSIRYTVPPQKDIPASSLVMTIEEPETDIFFVRFEYDDGTGDHENEEQAFYNDFRRSAYKEADIDTIRIIRQLAEEGRFDTPPI